MGLKAHHAAHHHTRLFRRRQIGAGIAAYGGDARIVRLNPDSGIRRLLR
jgi:hypothetical protein